jgi:hypothetical protein
LIQVNSLHLPCRIIVAMRSLQLAVGVALLAVLAILAQPVCQAYELGHGPQGAPASSSTQVDPGSADICCDDASGVSVVSNTMKSAEEAAVLVSAAALASPRASLPAYRPFAAGPPQRPLSYYARSARILR